MSPDVKAVLERAAERPDVEPDFSQLADRGRRRRSTKRVTVALSVVLLLAVSALVVRPVFHQPDVLFDTAPRQGVGRWTTIPPAPIGWRSNAKVLGDDRRLVVIGGQESGAESYQYGTLPSQGDVDRRNGAVFDRRSRTWARIPSAPIEPGRAELLADGRLLVSSWRGRARAAFYDFAGKAWTKTPPGPVEAGEANFWTGRYLITWGGWDEGGERNDGAYYDEKTGRWTSMAASPLTPRTDFAQAWTGDRLLVWGGGSGSAEDGDHVVYGDGAAFNPATNTWEVLPPAPLQARQYSSAIWVDGRFVVAGGDSREVIVGERKEPSTRVTNKECGSTTDGIGTMTSSCGMELTFDEPEMRYTTYRDGAVFDPKTSSWTKLPDPPAGRRGWYFPAADGGAMLWLTRRGLSRLDVREMSWHTASRPLSPAEQYYLVQDRLLVLNHTERTEAIRPIRLSGEILDPRSSRWDALSEADIQQRARPGIALTGDGLFVWGGESTDRPFPPHKGGWPSDDEMPIHTRHADGALLTFD